MTTLSEMLASNRGLSLTRDSNGVIRIIGLDVPTDFLNVRISHIVLEDNQRHPVFSQFRDVAFVGDARGMAFFKSKDIPRPMAFFMNAGFSKPLPDSPHISGTLDNVTVEGGFRSYSADFPRCLVLWELRAG